MLEYKNDTWKAWLALSPTIVLMVVFTFYPIVNTLFTAFMEGYTLNVWRSNAFADGWLDYFGQTITASDGSTYRVGLGFGSFVTIFKDQKFLDAIWNTVVIVFISVPVSVLISLFIAVALNGIKKLQGFFQTVYFLPYVTNTIALGLVFSALFSTQSGLVNSVLLSMGFQPIAWVRPYIDGGLMPTRASALFVLMAYTIWNGLAFKILVFLSGMQSIDKQYYQAAQVDATPRWRVFRRITVPLLSPMIAYITITSFIGAFKAYTSVVAVFQGRFGPTSGTPKTVNEFITIVGYTYEKLANSSVVDEISRASASALVLLTIIMIITAIQLWISKKKVHY